MPELIPYVNLKLQHAKLKEEILAAVSEVIDRGDFVLGQSVSEFEERFAELCGVKHAIALNSGTDALILAMKVLGIGPGDEVITPPNSFISTASAIALLGAKPVFVDVGPYRNINPALIEPYINKNTKLLLPVHLGGHPADINALKSIAQKHQLKIIDDCAQAVGSRYRGAPVGSLAEMSCFSLHPLKNLNACGDGGVITTDNDAWAEELRTLRNLGLSDRNTCAVWSSNSRLDTIQAAILLKKLEGFTEVVKRRQAIAQRYTQRLSACPSIELPVTMPDTEVSFHTYVIQTEQRDQLKEHLLSQQIKTSIHYPIPIHLQPAAQGLGHKPGDFPVTEQQSKRILTLPGFAELTDEQVDRVADTIIRFFNNNQ